MHYGRPPHSHIALNPFPVQVLDDQVCYKWSEYANLHDLFHARESLHRRVYTHRWETGDTREPGGEGGMRASAQGEVRDCRVPLGTSMACGFAAAGGLFPEGGRACCLTPCQLSLALRYTTVPARTHDAVCALPWTAGLTPCINKSAPTLAVALATRLPSFRPDTPSPWPHCRPRNLQEDQGRGVHGVRRAGARGPGAGLHRQHCRPAGGSWRGWG